MQRGARSTQGSKTIDGTAARLVVEGVRRVRERERPEPFTQKEEGTAADRWPTRLSVCFIRYTTGLSVSASPSLTAVRSKAEGGQGYASRGTIESY